MYEELFDDWDDPDTDHLGSERASEAAREYLSGVGVDHVAHMLMMTEAAGNLKAGLCAAWCVGAEFGYFMAKKEQEGEGLKD